jgi:hypothetical protein
MNYWLVVPVLCGAALAAQADDLRDPTRPPLAATARAAARAADPVVSAVFIGATHRAAIVDGRIVHAGDQVGGCPIDAVLDNGILYHCGGRVHELHVLPNEVPVKKPAATHARVASGEL